jgi:hypothetical protein
MYEGFAWLIITGSRLDDSDSLHSLLDYEYRLFCRDRLDSDLQIGHFFSLSCSLITLHSWTLNFLGPSD